MVDLSAITKQDWARGLCYSLTVRQDIHTIIKWPMSVLVSDCMRDTDTNCIEFIVDFIICPVVQNVLLCGAVVKMFFLISYPNL